jgi:hypothetical protein
VDLVAELLTNHKRVHGSISEVAHCNISRQDHQRKPKNNTKTVNLFPISDMSKQIKSQAEFMVSNKRLWTIFTSPLSKGKPDQTWAAAPKSAEKASSPKSVAPVSTLNREIAKSSGMHALTNQWLPPT